MTTTNKNLSTTHSLPIALLRARERVMGPVRDMLSDAGVTEQQWRVLRVLDEEGPLDPTTIASHAVLLLPSLTRILQKLEDKGLVTRERDQFDRRRHIIAATQAGTMIISSNMERSRDIMQNMRDQLGPRKFDALLDLLDELNQLKV
jgi:homoprotocatechuate degradation regulator HpaR